ncbi:MAG: cyclic nucleotide-binding domain-containing protein [Magnetococcales bacterium]|nr:cyclic nucleotide-binding domain-containing protein [Magnetococcales bacterium]
MAKIRKLSVTTGIDWVEIPKANLRILCGCPADSVKFLMRRGLIMATEQDGVSFETGPNAILLSDVRLQNGQLCNLAEFPVLQMLYRQGMIIPDHPNNTGQKPLIIGHRDQVDAQMQYIYRGNYGLISEEEIRAAGVSAAQAKEMMRLKRRFAFGRIRPTQELLDSVVVGTDPVSLCKHVTIRRLEINRFEISYKGESVTVDLTIPRNATYASPYALSAHNVKREYFAVLHSGDGDGWDINRPTMGSIVMFQGRIYLVDAGPNIQHSLNALGIGVNEVDGLFHTHAHDDHFAGITTLIRAGRRIKYFSTPLVRASVVKKLSALLGMEERNFSEFFEIIDLECDVWNDVRGLEVKPVFSPHPVETTLFYFRTMWEDGFKSYAHFADIADIDLLQEMVTDDPDADGLTEEACRRVKKAYAEPADIKKLDIGGGMIHGKAENFRNDASKRIILSHTALPLTDREKEIGSSAPFGIVDVLIPTEQEYARKQANDYLMSYFPDAPPHEIRILLNGTILSFNPETIILHENEINTNLFLLLNGSVEMIHTRSDTSSLLSAGAMVGEISGLYAMPSTATYRTSSYVRALRIPVSVYERFVRRNTLMADIERIQENISFLQGTCLFSGAISYIHQNRIARGMDRISVNSGETITPPKGSLIVVKRGRIHRYFGNDDTPIETLAVGDFFGEDEILFQMPDLLNSTADEQATLYAIPGDLLLHVPVVRWKLFEAHEHRRNLLFSSLSRDGSIEHLVWQESCQINVSAMDRQHRWLFELGRLVAERLRAKHDREVISKAFDSLVHATEAHFEDEMELLLSYDYAHAAEHNDHHGRLIKQIKEAGNSLIDGGNPEAFEAFFRTWLIDHILREDRRYAVHLNERGLF